MQYIKLLLLLSFSFQLLPNNTESNLYSLIDTLNDLRQSLNIYITPEKKDVRSIAVLAYGSLIGRPGELKIKIPFKKTPFLLPVNLTKKSQKSNKLVVTLDNKNGISMPAWYAPSTYTFLPDARANLAKREGSTGVNNTAYMKKLLPGRSPDPDEKLIPRFPSWVIKQNVPSQTLLSDDKAYEIAQWAEKNGFQAVIWASYSPTMTPEQARRELTNETVLKNTRDYLKQVPQETIDILHNYYQL